MTRWWQAAALAGLAAAAVGCWRRLGVRRVEVRGPSMEPTLWGGDRLLVRRAYRPPRVGEIVLARPRALGGAAVLKRVVRTEVGAGGLAVTLHGDNAAASTDSRTFGPVPVGEIVGPVWLRYWPNDRRGRVRRP